MPALDPSSLPFLGAGIGYRGALDAFFRKHAAAIGFYEVMPEHVLDGTEPQRSRLMAAAEARPTVTHSVSLSVGTAEGADLAFARRMRAVGRQLGAAWASDHLCFTKVPGRNIGQLTPFPYTEEALRVVVANVKAVQRVLGTPFLLENISQYFAFKGADFTEPEFFAEVTRRTGCGILLDVTNLRNNALNLGARRGTGLRQARAYLDAFPLDHVVQFHLAGSEWIGGKLLDTHGAAIHDDVWTLAQEVAEAHPVRALLIERDQTFGPLPQLAAELKRGQRIMAGSLSAQSTKPARAARPAQPTRPSRPVTVEAA